MEWKKILIPDYEEWEIQFDFFSYSESHKVGSLVYDTEHGWQSVINGVVECLYNAKTEEEAKRDFIERFETFIEREIEYYTELQMLIENFDTSC